MDYAQESLKLHAQIKGKIEVVTTVPVKNETDLSLAYTPGVAQPCLEIQKDVSKGYELTRRHNLCAVITDGTAVITPAGLFNALKVVNKYYFRTKCEEVICAMFCGCRRLRRRAKRLKSNDIIPGVYYRNNT